MEVRNALMDVRNEIEVMKDLQHVCVIRIHEVIDDPT